MALVETQFYLPPSLLTESLEQFENLAEENENLVIGSDDDYQPIETGKAITYHLYDVHSGKHLKVQIVPVGSGELMNGKEFQDFLDQWRKPQRKRRLTLRSLLESEKIAVGTTVFVDFNGNRHTAFVLQDGTLDYAGKPEGKPGLPGSFLRLVVGRRIGSTDYKKLQVFTKNGLKSWSTLRAENESNPIANTATISINANAENFSAMVNGCLHLAGVSESWIQTLLQDPFVDPENHHTAQETAQILLLAQLKDDGRLPDIFTPPSREIYELIISDLIGGAGHYSIDEALTFVIEYATGSFSRLDISGSFPHNSSDLDVPFKLGCDELVRYNMTKKNGGMPIAIARAWSPARNNEESLGFVYHATSWRFAEDILNNGIWLDQCRHSRDFGRRPSFYVSKSFRTAIEWVKKKRRLYSRQNAIIVYQLTQEMAERAGCSWKVLDGDTQEWRTVVFESRHGRRCGVDGFDFVEGPYLRNPPPSSTVADECSPSDHPHLQIACKSERGVGFLEGNLVGVVYLPQDDIGDTLLKNWL